MAKDTTPDPGSVTRLKAWPKTLTRDLTEDERRELDEAIKNEDGTVEDGPDEEAAVGKKGKRKR